MNELLIGLLASGALMVVFLAAVVGVLRALRWVSVVWQSRGTVAEVPNERIDSAELTALMDAIRDTVDVDDPLEVQAHILQWEAECAGDKRIQRLVAQLEDSRPGRRTKRDPS